MKTSRFLNCVKIDGHYLLHNTLYPHVIKVNDEKLFSVVERIISNIGSYELSFADEDCAQFYNDLVRAKIIVPDATNEINLVNYYFRKYMLINSLTTSVFGRLMVKASRPLSEPRTV